ncbi:alpha-mannosidase family protein [Colletotrichum karsti]|uniref:Alpha-mannosidase family protein n=1 Tax=Colletotrichum karsti TaxID=1095194 RepID=A0A9P6HTS2_9PEZI|nr:alpha-mannosidase family protein [Colletotrichum karsti]KAF9870064.1 alpha-mannosidase family protein [Colletotrichum karsti]
MRRFTLLHMASAVAAQSADLAGYVLTDTGSVGGGNTFPGVSRPLGMVKLGPDLENGVDAYSGYLPDGHFIGFSMLHETGTGGAPKYGVVNQMPIVGDVENPLSQNTDTRAKPDETEVGHYKSYLSSGVTVELGATEKAGLYQYSFPENNGSANVIVDVSHVLPSYRGQGLGQNYLGGKIEVKEGDDFHYEGFGSYDNGWNRAEEWKVYFCGYFDRPATFKTFLGKDLTSNDLSEYGAETSYESRTQRLGAVFTFEDTAINSRVGVSFISTSQACSNVNSQIPADTSLSSVREATREVWNTQVLSKVKTTETDMTKLNQLYTALYFMNLLPTNKTGENPLWDSEEPYYDDIFTFWDTFRCTTSLLHILQPVAYEEFIRSMIDIWRNEGYVSDARSSFWNGAVQGGSNSDNVLADAYVKGVRGKINWDDGLKAMLKNAEVVPPNNNDPRDRSSSTKEGRGALPDWLEFGYITPTFARAVTRAVEYATNDFAIHQVAKGMGLADTADKYLKRSRYWRNHWNKDMTALGFSGFMGPRNSDGSFPPQDPLDCGGCYWAEAYYQATPWEYSFNAHHDAAHMVELVGGAQNYSDRLEKTFEPGQYKGNGAFGNTIFNPGNEPSFGTPYLFNFVNKQHLTVERSRFVAKSYYKPTPDGLPGNSDAGAMESWLLWNMIGLYPLTGQTTFLIGSPWFSDLSISLGGGRQLNITSTGGGDDSFYVQSLRVNGEPWDKSWVTWGDIFADGGSLEFELGPEPKEWATGDLPPSPASEDSPETAPVLRQQRRRRWWRHEMQSANGW